MSVNVLLQGSLTKAPESRVSRQGNPFAMATLRVSAGNEVQFWRLFVFSESAQAELLRLGEGDSLAIQGVPKFEIYRPADGEPRVSLSVVADQVLALKQAPKTREKKAPAPPPATPEKPAPDRSGLASHSCDGSDPFGDEISF
jgi:single-stranded DNA-binding protein